MGLATCSICLEPLGQNIGRLVTCQHEYHLECIREWHNHSQDFKCPTCRVESNKLLDVENNVTINLMSSIMVDALINGLADISIGSDADGILTEPSVNQGTWGIVHPSLEEPSVSLAVLQCGICGVMDHGIDKCCQSCQCVYHEQCLRSLFYELGDRRDELKCADCYNDLTNFTTSSSSIVPCVHDVRNTRIFEGRIRDRRSIFTERLYRSRGDNREYERTNSTVMNVSEIEESWKLLSEAKKQQQMDLTLEHKSKIQQHVRKVLDQYYHRKKDTITKELYTKVNKCVSRKLYQMSGDKYQATLDYENEAHRLILRELSVLGL